MATNLGEGKLWIQTTLILLKIDLMSHPVCGGGVGWICMDKPEKLGLRI